MAPSPKLVADCKKIADNGGELASEPYAYMKLAHEYAERACHLSGLAFGVVGALILQTQYETSRKAISDSIDGGTKQLDTAAEGLVKVANTIAGAEVASAASAKAKRDPGFKYTEPQHSAGLRNAEGLGLFAGARVALTVENVMIATVNGASAALAPTAIAAVALWILFTPNDDELSKAIGGWQAVATQMTGVTGETWQGVTKSVPELWEGDSHTAFKTWADIFSEEVNQTKTAAETNQKALETIMQQLDHLQNEMFYFASGSLIAIIAFAIGEKAPYIGPICAVLKQIQGAILSGGTATAVAAVAALLAAGFGPLKQMFDSFGTTFAKLAANKGGGVSFTDINISWTSPPKHY